ncbi:MAG TPA: HAD family hydrolase [Bacillota bacterium]|nr:HAD family hydrolase [Bacillota bacterium]HPZ90833.1 HAD family hydrolase [Bacillota bacterium]HQE02539.1 HAD family hydrolase [Bacillota bacterium]
MQIYNHKISLIAFDLDDTLLTSSGNISKTTLEKIDQVRSRGVKITICSGRISYMQQLYVLELGIQGPYVGCNGALVVNSVDGSIVFSKTIDPGALKRLAAFTRNIDLHLCVQAANAFYITPGSFRTPVFLSYQKKIAERGLPVVPVLDLDKDFGNYDGSPVYKLVYYITSTRDREQLALLKEFLDGEPELAYTISGENMFEVIPPGVDKGTGIERVAEFYGIPLKEVCAFGDYDNDIPLFQKAGFSVAMGNASDNLKAWANYITDTNDNDGIAKALEALDNCFG